MPTKKPKKMKYTFEVKESDALTSQGEWYWSCRHANGKLVAWSGETYKRRADCKRALTNLLQTLVAGYDYEIKDALGRRNGK